MSCYEDASATNSYGLDCATIAAAGYCGYTETDLWVGGDTNIGMCLQTCGMPGCGCTEIVGMQNRHGARVSTRRAAARQRKEQVSARSRLLQYCRQQQCKCGHCSICLTPRFFFGKTRRMIYQDRLGTKHQKET